MKLRLRSFGALSACCFFPLAQAQAQPIPQNPKPDLQSPPVVTSLPARARGSGGGCTFGGPFLYVHSKTADPQGILVRVSPPSKGRYSQGAPIAVHMISAVPRVNGSIACLSEQGFIDVGFLCPGGQYKSLDGSVMKSGGSALPPDPQRCVEPLADVIVFATGKTHSVDGKSIQDYAGSVKVLTNNTGVIGWSLGGDLAILAMAATASRISNGTRAGSQEFS